jgi:hypothetical protein
LVLKSRKIVELVFAILLVGSLSALAPDVRAQDDVFEGDMTFTVYPDMSFEARIVGGSEWTLEPWESTPPFRNVAFELVNRPLGVNLTEAEGTLVVKLVPEYAEDLAALDLDVEVHTEGGSSEATVEFNLPGYVGVDGRIGFAEDGDEGTLEAELTVEVWYSLYPREYVEMFIEGFPFLKAQLVSQVSESTEGKLAVEELTIVDSDVGPVSATLALTASVVGDFEGLSSIIGESAVPYIDVPGVDPDIDYEELVMTSTRSSDLHVTFDKEELAFNCAFEGVLEGDLDRQANVIKNLVLEESLKESRPDPETTRMINDFLLPTEVVVSSLNMMVEFTQDESVSSIEFSIDGLGLKPPSAEALLRFLEGASEDAEPGFTLTLEGASDGGEQVEIVVPSTTADPVSKEPTKVVWEFVEIEDLSQVTFEEKKPKAPTLLTPQVAIRRSCWLEEDDTPNA